MAVTKIKPIKSTLSKALDYIENPDKTDGKMLVSSFGCSYETADIALFGKLPLILANCVPPVFFILEIFLCFFGKLQLVQFVDKIITVIFFAADSGIEPVTVKVLCKVDMGAIFVPLFLAGGEERNEVFLVISLLGGVGLVVGLTALINTLFPSPMTETQVISGSAIIFACALLAFAVSCPVTVYIYLRKEY